MIDLRVGVWRVSLLCSTPVSYKMLAGPNLRSLFLSWSPYQPTSLDFAIFLEYSYF